MKRRRRIFIAAIVSVAFLTAAGAIVQQKYEPIVAAPVITYDSVATARHTLRAVFCPPLARGALSGLIDLPEWMVMPFAPREVALLVEPDLASNTIRLRVFVNEQRLGPVIAGYVSEPDLSKDVPFVDWDARGFVREERGSMVLEGSIAVPPETAALWRATAQAASASGPLALDGSHMFEVAMNNEDGGALAAFLTLYGCLDKGPAPFDPQVLAKSFSSVTSIRMFADFTSDDAAEVRLVLAGRPGAETEMASLAFLTEVVCGEAASELGKDAYKIGLSGSTEREGSVVTVKMGLSGLARFFRGEDGDA